MMSDCNKAVLLIIDVQQKLFPVMSHSDDLKIALTKLTKGIKTLEIPILLTEQYPEGLGPTIPEIAELLPGAESPTVLPLEEADGKVAVHVVCRENVFWSTLEDLKKARNILNEIIICIEGKQEEELLRSVVLE